MGIESVEVGQSVTFSKTVGETDVYLFAGITGDFSGNHVDEEYMRRSVYGRRVAHGVLMIGFMSTASSLFADKYGATTQTDYAVSLGYDKIRFLAPVFIGDTVTVTYRMEEIDPPRLRAVSNVTVVNQDGVTVAAGKHILKWLQPKAA